MSSNVIGIIGLGLLGGSLAKALSLHTSYRVIGYARRQSVCDKAIASGAVAVAYTSVVDVVKEADILVFALPPDINGVVFNEVAPLIKKGALVTDVSSTKHNFVQAVYKYLPSHARFVSIHPMAGSEKGGFEEAKSTLFEGCTWIVIHSEDTPCWSDDGAAELRHWGELFGAHIEEITMAEHDAYMASISHMPHLVAGMVATVAGGDVDGEQRLRLAAGGFRDITRVAGGNPSMWREIIMGNAECIDAALASLETEISRVRHLLAETDSEGMEAYLKRAKKIRDTFASLLGGYNERI